MVSKKILGLAIAAAFSSQAFAVIDLNDKDAAGSKVVYAKEALTTTLTGNDNGTYYVVGYTTDDTGVVLDMQVKYGTGIAATQKRFVRIDLSNALFTANSALASTTSGGGTAAGVLVQGGQSKDTYAILEVTASVAVGQDSVANINVNELAISGSAAVGVTATVYETLTAAVNQTASTALNTKTLASAVTTESAVKFTATPATVTADVSSDFKKFVNSTAPLVTDTYANLGTLTVAPGAALKPTADDLADVVVLADVIVPTTSAVKFTGDFSVGDFYLAAAPASQANCVAGSKLAFNEAKTQATKFDGGTDIFVAGVNAASTLCVVVPGDKVIPKGSYSAEATYTKVGSAAFPPAAQSGVVGNIAHNGTTVQVPYLTTFEDYNQRLVLVNRGGAAAAYSINFTPEAGVTATAGSAATGTIPAGKTLVVSAKDVVALSGSSRTAATVNIVAVPGNIDAAATQVNLSDKSTDTVNLH
jgi:hypothetical protein